MNTDILYFSATGTTKKIVHSFAAGLNGELRFFDITLPSARRNLPVMDGDVIVIAAPVYGERIPDFIMRFLEGFKGGGRPLVGISVYGNMGLGISLEQYAAFAKTNGFALIAEGAFIGQHTYASARAPVALNRPDQADLADAMAFGVSVKTKLQIGDLSPVVPPKSNLPKFLAKMPDGTVRVIIRAPKIDLGRCNACGACAKRCPLGAIDPVSLAVDSGKCIRCFACVQVCSKNARTGEFRFPIFQSIFRKLGSKPKPNSTFLD